MVHQDIPTTVVTGALGAGKTTIIVNLVNQLPKDYKMVWLKNEYGDVNIDSELAKESNIQTTEVLNGCLCCVLIGKLHEAVEEIKQKYHPERLIIETAGTAHPFPIVNEINNSNGIFLDGLITVVDALNYKVFEDKSYLARKQAQYVDLVIINKAGLVSEAELEDVMDDVYDLYPRTPKITTKDGMVDKDLIIGIDARFAEESAIASTREVFEKESAYDHHVDDVETFTYTDEASVFDFEAVETYLLSLKPGLFYRIKGIVKGEGGYRLLNYVLGRVTWEGLHRYSGPTKIAFMGKNVASLKKDVLTRLDGCKPKSP